MIYHEREDREHIATQIARHLLAAARTAPKARGVDIVECAALDGAEKDALADELERLGAEREASIFLRDAKCIRTSLAVVLVGTREQPLGLNCARCGFPTCKDRAEGVPCAINSVDVGIALGSVASLAADFRVDTRIMFTAGVAAESLHLLGDEVTQIYALPISISSKSPLFDRK